MMKTIRMVTLVAILLLTAALPATQPAPLFVNLKVSKDGKTVPPPPNITLTFAGHSTRTAILNGRFGVPQEIVLAARTDLVEFSANFGTDHVGTSIMAGGFTREYWSLLLTDRHFEDQYQSMIPKGEDPRSVCVFVFAGKTSESTSMVSPHCRSSVKK